MASVFDDLLATGVRKGQIPARTKDAREWFRAKARGTANAKIYPANIEKELGDRKARIGPGRMYYFRYDPKHKKTLPYYDEFPLIFMVGPAPGGFYGCNMHYLPPKLRAQLMDALYGLTTDQRYDERTRLALSYKVLQGASKYRYFEPTFKHYLNDHMRSDLIEIYSAEWDIALFLPNERFQKANKQRVYADSRKKIS